jgi:hypothetical protein
MKTKTKQDYQDNKVVLNGNKLYFYKNDKLFKITEHLSYESALQEFNNITMSYRGCGKGNTRRKREVATVYYNQLIIRL